MVCFVITVLSVTVISCSSPVRSNIDGASPSGAPWPSPLPSGTSSVSVLSADVSSSPSVVSAFSSASVVLSSLVSSVASLSVSSAPSAFESSPSGFSGASPFSPPWGCSPGWPISFLVPTAMVIFPSSTDFTSPRISFSFVSSLLSSVFASDASAVSSVVSPAS